MLISNLRFWAIPNPSGAVTRHYLHEMTSFVFVFQTVSYWVGKQGHYDRSKEIKKALTRKTFSAALNFSHFCLEIVNMSMKIRKPPYQEQ